MQHRTVEDVMTRQVITAHRDTAFKTIVELLARNDVTALPVVDEQCCLVGIVSEGDLLCRESVQPDPEGRPSSTWLLPKDRARAFAETAEGLMTTTVFTACPGWSLVETARAINHHQVKRLPVVDEAGRLVGIVSRGDLLRVYLRPDRMIREEITREVLHRTLRLALDRVQVDVADGVVTLRGELDLHSQVVTLLRLCRTVDGVVAVHDQLLYVGDDRTVDVNPATLHGVLHYRA
jgi:CBS-domain-containing membrane protein